MPCHVLVYALLLTAIALGCLVQANQIGLCSQFTLSTEQTLVWCPILKHCISVAWLHAWYHSLVVLLALAHKFADVQCMCLHPYTFGNMLSQGCSKEDLQLKHTTCTGFALMIRYAPFVLSAPKVHACAECSTRNK